MRAKTAPLSALVAVLALLPLTACTGDGDTGPDAKPSAARTGSSTPPGAAGDTGTGGGDASVPLTGTQLEHAALAGDDLSGFQVSGESSALAPSGQPTAGTKRCQPLADAMGDKPDPRAAHTVNRGLGSLKNLGLAVSASLSSYSDGDAAALMSGLKAALADCGDGFDASLDGRSASYDAVKSSPFTADGADEVVSWTVVATNEGVEAPLHLVVVRKGATVARFMALDLARRTPPRVPQEVADKQLAKVGRTIGG